jgi:hypothetical protein
VGIVTLSIGLNLGPLDHQPLKKFASTLRPLEVKSGLRLPRAGRRSKMFPRKATEAVGRTGVAP